jgi:Ankyrin repeats (3 copies)
MVRYFLTDLRGNPIYSFAQRLRRNRLNNPPLFTPPRRFLSPAYLQDHDDEIDHAEDLIPAYASSSSTKRLQRTTNFVSICLVCLIRNQAWDDALKRIQSHPAEVLLMDALTGNTVLHTACRLGPPPAIVVALAVEATARHANYEGATPLHMAASHRCSADSIQALLDACRNLPIEDHGSMDEGAAKHTSPTADLSRMGRAPIHYACMSFRGLDIAAFRLLLDDTLREGNVWVWERQEGGDDYLDEPNQNNEMHSMSLLNQGSKVLEVEEEEEDEMGDEHETRDDINDLGLCEFEYELDRDLYHQYPKSISMEDLTLDGSKKEGSRYPIKVLVNVMGIKDATGQTPLGLLFRRYRERVRCIITAVDKIRQESQAQRAALVAAIRVNADLGELWEKARWIVARLTEERLLRERLEQGGQDATDHSMEEEEESYPYHLTKTLAPVIPPVRRDATSRRATYYGGSAKAIPAMPPMGRRSVRAFDTEFEEPPSPVAQEAASWAVELHPTKGEDANSLILPFAPDISTALPDRFLPKTKETSLDETIQSSSGTTTGSTAAGSSPPPRLLRPNNFRIVHASVGLTGYGCPPELIRLAISIHPNQVMEMDQDGNLPIHIAVTAASYLANANPPISQQEKDELATANDDHSVMSALSFFSSATVSHTSNPFDKVMKILLQHYPAGAWTPQGKTGRLPLVLAIESKGKRTWADGIRTLLQAYPPALHNRKVMEPILYPHVLSLVAAGPGGSDRKRSRHEACSRSTLFGLLRSKPEWLTRGFIAPEGEE